MRAKLKQKIAEVLKVPIEKLKDDAVLTELVQDSFILIEMIIEIQEEFKFRIDQEDLANVRTLSQLLDVVETKIQ